MQNKFNVSLRQYVIKLCNIFAHEDIHMQKEKLINHGNEKNIWCQLPSPCFDKNELN